MFNKLIVLFVKVVRKVVKRELELNKSLSKTDLEAKLKLLKSQGVLGYKDKDIEVRFNPYVPEVNQQQTKRETPLSPIKNDFSSYSKEEEDAFLFPK